MEYRKVFDIIPEQFDAFRPRYSAELFRSLIDYVGLDESKSPCPLHVGSDRKYPDSDQQEYLLQDHKKRLRQRFF